MADETKPNPANPPKVAIGKQAPEAIKTDPEQASRLANEGDTGQADVKVTTPSVQSPRGIVAEDLVSGAVDPEGRVKQQDAAGNFLADENEIRKEGTEDRKKFDELRAASRRSEDAANSSFADGQSGTHLSAENHEFQRQRSAAVHTDSRTSPFKSRAAAAQKELESLADQRSAAALARRAQLNAQLNELRELENRRVQGAPTRLPRGLMLDLGDLPSKYPDRHFRWVNVEAPGKAAAAQAVGYTRVSPSEGGKQIGDLALFWTSQENRYKRVAEQDTRNRDAQESFKNEIRAAAEKVVEEIYNKTGKDISKGRGTLLVEDQ